MLWVGLGLTLVLLVLATSIALLKNRSSASGQKAPPVLGTIAPFTLTNQNGVVITEKDLSGKVWVADIIFTRCAGPCLRMSAQMSKIQAGLLPSSEALLVSLTTDPEFDTPEVLKTYGARFDADPKRWMFLTGSKEELRNLATDSLKLTALEKTPEQREDPEDLFIHSTIFVVVDKQLRLRGIFETEGEGVDAEAMRPKLLEMISTLEREI